ncbi:uncharacterized protein DS421_9g274510 [Arachis hypogaea]|nr:uncharacterized protein LOC114924502 [Arachis hypogaea]QHO35323.1 uncharacterized protein DS421_9g274510 [Arachis hypogaea]
MPIADRHLLPLRPSPTTLISSPLSLDVTAIVSHRRWSVRVSAPLLSLCRLCRWSVQASAPLLNLRHLRCRGVQASAPLLSHRRSSPISEPLLILHNSSKSESTIITITTITTITG